MLFNSETVYFIIWAAVIGIAFSVVYTNLQRDALSKFITALIEKNSDCEESALTLQELNLSGFASTVVKSAVKSQNGLKRAVTVFEVCKKKTEDDAELLILGNKPEYRYCITDGIDCDELIKKYSFKRLPLLQIIAILACVIITAVIATKAVDILDSFASSRNEEQQNQEQNKEMENQQNNEESLQNEKLNDTIVLPESNSKDKMSDISPSDKLDNIEKDGTDISRPSIPMLPTAQ